MGRKPLKSHETTTSDFSRLNDFNSLRGVWRNKFLSQPKMSVSEAKSPHGLSQATPKYRCSIFSLVIRGLDPRIQGRRPQGNTTKGRRLHARLEAGHDGRLT